jgi:chromosome segregation ATPase
MDMAKIEEVILNGTEADLNELRLFLFKESCRLENQESSLDDQWQKLRAEQSKAREEIDRIRKQTMQERYQLERDTALFESRLKILTEGFEKLNEDKKQIQAEQRRLNQERRMLMEDISSMDDRIAERSADIMGILFKGADNELALKKRYRELMKIFHPDNCSGDDELVQMLNIEYSRLSNECIRRDDITS